MLAGNHEVDREWEEFPTTKRLVAPNLDTYSGLVDPVGKQKAYAFGSTQGNLVNAAEHSNPLIVGPESGLSQYGQSEAKNDHIEKYSRYDPNKMYSSPLRICMLLLIITLMVLGKVQKRASSNV